MKKKYWFLLIITSTFFLGCSSDDSTNVNSYDFGTMNFTLEGYYSFSTFDDTGCYIDRTLNNDNTKTYWISSFMRRDGNNPIFEQDVILPDFRFTIPNDIVVNQIIPISSLNIGNPSNLELPYNNNNFNLSTAFNFCDRLELKINANSTGSLKITQIDNDFVYGNFEFNNLNNVGGFDFNGNPCSNYPSQQNFNIINGTFKARK
jgi:hypothetical protein